MPKNEGYSAAFGSQPSKPQKWFPNQPELITESMVDPMSDTDETGVELETPLKTSSEPLKDPHLAEEKTVKTDIHSSSQPTNVTRTPPQRRSMRNNPYAVDDAEAAITAHRDAIIMAVTRFALREEPLSGTIQKDLLDPVFLKSILGMVGVIIHAESTDPVAHLTAAARIRALVDRANHTGGTK